MFDINNFDDPKVWDLICEGNTKGVFQLESNLGKHWAKQTKPRNIKDLAALVSLIRPGTLMAKDANGKSMTPVYADRKAGKTDSPVEYLHESLEPILKETYGVLVYQEQSMMIAQRLAGFNLKEADGLRKAIGKKKADLMAKVKKDFLIGTQEQGIVSTAVAEEIFSWIEKSSRYAFNKSHAVSYAINAYWSAYCKTHRVKKFFEKYLDRADRKPKPDIEKKQLIMDAKKFDIEVLPPRLQHLYVDFTRHPDKNIIYYGLNHVKHVGTKECEKINNLKETHGDVSDYTWMDCLIRLINELNINKRATIAMISAGAFNGKNNRLSRATMLYEYDSWRLLTARERGAIVHNYSDPSCHASNLSEAIGHLIEGRSPITVNKKRMLTLVDIKGALDNPFYDIEDNPRSLAMAEEKYMSCALTCSKLDAIDLSVATYSCRDLENRAVSGKVNLAVEINFIKVVKTKRGDNPGQEMAFLTVEDSTGSLDDITVFPDVYGSSKHILIQNNTVLLCGEISKKDKKSLIVNNVKHI
jgi:DNA polymerase-3 subunit alpha